MGQTNPTDVERAALAFVEAFEAVFGNDWSYTKSMLGIHDDPERDRASAETIKQIFGEEAEVQYMISPEGTFIDPKVDDEVEDWGNRALLLETYRTLKKLLVDRGWYSQKT